MNTWTPSGSTSAAIAGGYRKGFGTIVDANVVTVGVAFILFMLATAGIKGFAFTLGMSTVLDLVVVFLVTYPLVLLASKNKFLSRPSMSGLGAVQRMADRQRKPAAGPVVKEA